MMISTVTGKFGNFEGTYELDKGMFKSLKGDIKAASIDTGIVKRDDHLRSADFFDPVSGIAAGPGRGAASGSSSGSCSRWPSRFLWRKRRNA